VERQLRSRFNTQIYDEACEWFIECRAGELDETSRSQFDCWLRKSPEHLSAYLEIAAIWNEGPSLDPSSKWDRQALVSQATQDTGNVVTLARGELAAMPPTEVPPRRRRVFAIAACVAILGLAAAATSVWLVPLRAPEYVTATGEQRSLALEDGSAIELNSRSKIQVRYSRHERTIDLLQGQALFHVAKDTARPFVVRSGEMRVSAVGTQFDMYQKPSGTVVTVLEGRVAVRSVILATGEQAIITPKTVRKTEHPNLAAATAWTQRQIVFDSASLTEVAEEFNRYNQRELVIDRAALGNLHVSGIFSSTDSASLIRFLRQRPGLRITETATEIRVEKGNP
jgi:transmembrane sensor